MTAVIVFLSCCCRDWCSFRLRISVDGHMSAHQCGPLIHHHASDIVPTVPKEFDRCLRLMNSEFMTCFLRTLRLSSTLWHHLSVKKIACYFFVYFWNFLVINHPFCSVLLNFISLLILFNYQVVSHTKTSSFLVG